MLDSWADNWALKVASSDLISACTFASSACQSAILTEYYAANGQVLCANCADAATIPA